MSLDPTKFRIIRYLDKDGDVRYKVQQKKFGMYWNISFLCSTYVEIAWGSSTNGNHFWNSNFATLEIARNSIFDAMHSKAKDIKRNLRELQKIDKRKSALGINNKANAYKIIKFP